MGLLCATNGAADLHEQHFAFQHRAECCAIVASVSDIVDFRNFLLDLCRLVDGKRLHLPEKFPQTVEFCRLHRALVGADRNRVGGMRPRPCDGHANRIRCVDWCQLRRHSGQPYVPFAALRWHTLWHYEWCWKLVRLPSSILHRLDDQRPRKPRHLEASLQYRSFD